MARVSAVGRLIDERLVTSERDSWARHRWHSEDVDVFPTDPAAFGDLPALIREHVVRGHVPPRPLLTQDDRVLTLGSCFAAELRSLLGRVEFGASSMWIPAGLNNTYAILDFVSWCVTGRETDRGFRYDRMDDGGIREWTPEGERTEYLDHLRSAGAFVFTVGLAEVWEDADTGAVFWRGIPEEVYDASRHRFRLTTVEENETNLVRIVELLRTVNRTAPIVYTLSPVPLRATFRPISCVTADCVSKSVLRVALDGVIARGLENVHYWPSFEVVRWVGAHAPYRAYGYGRGDGQDARHVGRYLVAHIVSEFVRAYYGPDAGRVFVERLRAAGADRPRPDTVRARVRRARRLSGLALARARRLARH